MALKCPFCGYENKDDALSCNLCQNVLKREKKGPPPRDEESAAPVLKNDYPAIAEKVVAEAASGDPVLGGFGLELNYSPASIAAMDELISERWGTKGDAPGEESYAPSSDTWDLIMGLGSYFGEVMRRSLGGYWEEDPERPDDPLSTRVCLAGDVHALPIAKVFDRFNEFCVDTF